MNYFFARQKKGRLLGFVWRQGPWGVPIQSVKARWRREKNVYHKGCAGILPLMEQ